MLSLSLVKKFENYAEQRGVSKVARSQRGFLTQYKNGNLTPEWKAKREAFIARHLAKAKKDNEPTLEQSGKYKGMPTRRETALIMWAFSRLPQQTLKKIKLS